jgi:hypothetical protein
VSKKATLEEKDDLPLPVPGHGGTWDVTRYKWWWRLADHNDFDQCAMSHYHETPHGKMRYAMCPECMMGPLGIQNESDPEVLVSCDLVKQQDLSFANDALDFRAPEGLDISQLVSAGAGSMTYPFEATEHRLGMQLRDGAGAAEGTVEVAAFTELDGELGAAELSGKVRVGDRVTRVGAQSCLGLDCDAVLGLIIGGARPLTILFERNGPEDAPDAAPAPRVQHDEYRSPIAEIQLEPGA